MNGVSIIYNAVLAGDPEAILFCSFMGIIAFLVGMMLFRIPKYLEEKNSMHAKKFSTYPLMVEGGPIYNMNKYFHFNAKDWGYIIENYDDNMNKHSKYLNKKYNAEE